MSTFLPNFQQSINPSKSTGNLHPPSKLPFKPRPKIKTLTKPYKNLYSFSKDFQDIYKSYLYSLKPAPKSLTIYDLLNEYQMQKEFHFSDNELLSDQIRVEKEKTKDNYVVKTNLGIKTNFKNLKFDNKEHGFHFLLSCNSSKKYPFINIVDEDKKYMVNKNKEFNPHFLYSDRINLNTYMREQQNKEIEELLCKFNSTKRKTDGIDYYSTVLSRDSIGLRNCNLNKIRRIGKKIDNWKRETEYKFPEIKELGTGNKGGNEVKKEM